MTADSRKQPDPSALADAVRQSIEKFLFADVFESSGTLGHLDRWSKRRVAVEIMAKTNLMLEAKDPVTHCYQNLIREIDSEAEMGVLLANASTAPESLQDLCEDPGVSGELYREIDQIAPIVFPDEFVRSNGDIDLLWASVQALYDRAHLDVSASELAIAHFLENADSVADMTRAMRSLFYSFYEEGIRRQFDLPSLLDETEVQQLFVTLSDLMMRAGSYEDRLAMIQSRARAG